jgi:hypothetical protein
VGRLRAVTTLHGLALLALACRPGTAGDTDRDRSGSVPAADSGFTAVAESAWVNVTGTILIGFHPVVTNEQLEKDEDLAAALDDFAYHIGTAMDSLTAAGATVHYRGGDTVWMRSGAARWRFVRSRDSADIGYVFTDSLRRLAPVYGVRTHQDLIEFVHEFRRTGAVRSR